MILFMVEYGNAHVITFASGREQAKQNAKNWLGDYRRPLHDFYGNNPDNYTVTPLTEPGDRIHLDITVSA
jgi:hypothetical protein